MTKVLVTGGAGFIGSVVVKQLLNAGYEVACFDLRAQVARNSPPREVEVFQGDILSLDDLVAAAKGCQYVIHLAAMLGVKRTQTERLQCLDINIGGIRNTLEASVRAEVKRIIFSSSSEVYGQQERLPISEENPLYPKSPYAISKIAGEQYVVGYKQCYGLDYSVVRFFNVYGEGQVAEFVMPRFIRSVLCNQPPVIYGNGEQIRAFCHVEDIGRGVVLALANQDAASEILNIGNDKEPISVKDLAYKIARLAQKDVKPKFVPIEDSDRERTAEVWQRVPDISKARRLLGYEPTISLTEGILKIMEHYKFE